MQLWSRLSQRRFPAVSYRVVLAAQAAVPANHSLRMEATGWKGFHLQGRNFLPALPLPKTLQSRTTRTGFVPAWTRCDSLRGEICVWFTKVTAAYNRDYWMAQLQKQPNDWGVFEISPLMAVLNSPQTVGGRTH